MTPRMTHILDPKTQSLAVLYPDLVKEWSPLNECGPDEVHAHEYRKRWWRCEKGHDYTQSTNNRTNRANSNGCPYCDNKKVLPGFNDLSTVAPHLVSQYDLEKNDLPPNEVGPGSGKVYWKCDKGHSWSEYIHITISRRHGCPICNGHRVIPGLNSLAALRPDLMEEWDYDANMIDPDRITPIYEKKAAWICRVYDRPYQTTPRCRTRHGCPICSGRVVASGINDLKTLYPELAKEYSPDNEVPASMVKPRSGIKRIWICRACGNRWLSTPDNRLKGRGCPECAKKIGAARRLATMQKRRSGGQSN